jgi:hydroxylamine reductase
MNSKDHDMFCYQCEQTAGSKGCVKVGVCSKSPSTAALQDLLVYLSKGIAYFSNIGRPLGIKHDDVDIFVAEAMFSTLTNVDFDNARFVEWINRAVNYRENIKKEVEGKKVKLENLPEAATIKVSGGEDELVQIGKKVGIMADEHLDMDVRSLRQLLVYGMKGMCAYADHAHRLNERDEEVFANMHKSLAATLDDGLTAEQLFNLNMELGQANLKCMEALDRGNTKLFGKPTPTQFNINKKKGPFIVISGHDMLDLEMLLKQTEGKGINIYTPGEMLPAHGYPELHKYKHLVGNFGGAWQEQQKEFDNIPGCILMTTNCLMMPRESYKDRLFTTGLVGWPGIKHVCEDSNGNKDFTDVINKALELGGFTENEPEKMIMTGFAHDAVMAAAPKLIELIKQGKIRHIFLVGGCDGARPGRNYFTQFAEQVPKDCIILTVACGKFRFNKLDFGDIEGIPRLLDVGQCNDSYSAIQIALALSGVFECGVNDLPLSIVLSWYEQKAVAVLITLLSLGIKDIRLGPTLPAFVTPNILQILIDRFAIKPISTPEADLMDILGKK